jgi:hypothetical protein
MEESSGGRSNSTLVRCLGDTISQTDKDLGEKGEKGAIIRGTLGARQPKVGIISGEAWPELKGGRRPDKGNRRLTLAVWPLELCCLGRFLLVISRPQKGGSVSNGFKWLKILNAICFVRLLTLSNSMLLMSPVINWRLPLTEWKRFVGGAP